MNIFIKELLKRKIHTGHVKKVLNEELVSLWRSHGKKIGDQRERWDGKMREVKYEKDKLTRELMIAKRDLLGVFSLRKASQILDSSQEKKRYNSLNENEARRIYRILRPEAQSFFEEQASTHLKRSMNDLLMKSKKESSEIVPIEQVEATEDPDPVFTSSSYTLSVISILNSMVDDLYKLCEYFEIEGLPERSYRSYDKIFQNLESFFKLRRDGTDVEQWVERVWEKLRPQLISELEEITKEEIVTWLKGHLTRVTTNMNSQEKKYDEWYDFTEDILYDSMPYSEKVAIGDKIGYPLEEASEYLSRMLSLFKDLGPEMLDELIESLKGLGLKEWFNLSPNEVELGFFGPEGHGLEDCIWTKQDKDLSYLLIETVSRSMEHLLDIENYSPSSMLSTICKNLKRNLFEASENKWLPSAYIKEMIKEVYENKSNESELREYVETPLKQMLISDYKYSHQMGSIMIPRQSNISEEGVSKEKEISEDYSNALAEEINERLSSSSTRSNSGDYKDGTSSVNRKGEGNKEEEKDKQKWKWVVPSVDSIFDSNRNMYIRNKSNLDPLMRLDNLKSFIVSRKRMRSMTKEGRVYFIRVVVAIGDGNGYFGMGIGYGNDVNSAKNAGIENGLKNMYFIDYDPFESLTTPVLGREYGSRCVIEGRQMSKGVKCNRKFLPLVYLIGLNNVKFKLKGTNSWVTRIRSIRKSLESIMSRRTISKMLGKRYAEVSAPGDDTIHWSDEWFNPILKEYQNKINKLRRMRYKFSRRNRYKYNILLPMDIKTVVPNYSRSTVNRNIKLKTRSN